MSGRSADNLFDELCRDYPAPEHVKFFLENRDALLADAVEIKTEAQLKSPEFVGLELIKNNLSYDYPSTKISSVEDLVLSLLEIKRGLEELAKADRVH